MRHVKWLEALPDAWLNGASSEPCNLHIQLSEHSRVEAKFSLQGVQLVA